MDQLKIFITLSCYNFCLSNIETTRTIKDGIFIINGAHFQNLLYLDQFDELKRRREQIANKIIKKRCRSKQIRFLN